MQSRWALKEWAAICAALAAGRQAILLRKGGIAEPEGEFRSEHQRFWLLRTAFHQSLDQLAGDAAPWLSAARASRPAAGHLQIAEFAVVEHVWFVDREETVEKLAPWHCWSAATIASRFHYRQPGLFVLAPRVFRRSSALEIVETPQIAGCRSWVELPEPIDAGPLTPALSDAQYHDVVSAVGEICGAPAG